MRSPCGKGCSERSDPIGCLTIFCQYSELMSDKELSLWVLELPDDVGIKISAAHAKRLAMANLALGSRLKR